MVRLLFVSLVLYASLFSAQPRAEVELTINQSFYSYSSNPRLVDVLYPVALQESWYWPDSKLFRSNTHDSQKLRAQVVSMLENEIGNNTKPIYNSIISQIKGWELADRINIRIDFELARISDQHNPLLEDGQYRLLLSKRPNKIYIFGAVENAFNVPYPNNTCIKDFVSNLTLSTYADKSHIFIISPLGTIEKSPIAEWNSKCKLLMPGAILYVPLQESLFSSIHGDINTNLVNLVTNRVATQ